MILTCPSCGTQYVVKDGAIPPEGRHVRCAACKHSWHQDPEVSEESPPPVPAAHAQMLSPDAVDQEPEVNQLEDRTKDNESLGEAALIEPRSGPEAEERAYEESVIEGAADPEPAGEPVLARETTDQPTATAADWSEPPEAEAVPDMFSPFALEDEEQPRTRGTLGKILIAILAIVAIAVAFWFLAPASVKSRLGLALAADSPLQVSNPPHVERVQLASGNELLTVSGRVINPTSREQQVPPLNARLTNQKGKLVYSWTIAPPARSLAAGASASFNSAEVNVPAGGEYLTITLGEKA